jgi:hypothetical protein
VARAELLRLTVARRRRVCTVFPARSLRWMWRRISASRSGRNTAIPRVNDLAKRQNNNAPHNNLSALRRVLVAPGAQMHARPARGPQLDLERRFEDLLEQLPLINGGRRPDAQASAVVQQHNLVGEFRR